MEIRNIVILVIFILGLVYMQYIQAHSVDEIINKYTDALGGKDKLNAIKSVYMEGIRQLMSNEITLKITKVQGELYRNDFMFSDHKGYIIVTPGKGWLLIPFHNIELIPEGRLKAMQTDLDIAGPVIDYAVKGNKVHRIGKEDIDGRETHKIKLTLTTGKEITYYFDLKTHLLLQTRQLRPGMGKHEQEEREVITSYSDYLPVDDVLFPHTINTSGNGPGAGLIKFSKIEVNVPVDQSLYRPMG